jgi:hypothetical protein
LIGQEAERAPLRKNFRDWILRYVCNAAADSAKYHKLSHCIFAAVDGEHQLIGFLTTHANPSSRQSTQADAGDPDDVGGS